jgi:hypothetical protein
MGSFKGCKSLALTVTILLSVMIIGGCATAIKYSYDTKASFSEQKSYAWSPASGMSRQDSLLEANVQTLADQLLVQKGFTRTSEKADLMISMNYEFDSGSYHYGYQLRMLTLSIYKIRHDIPSPVGMSRELVWRGTASGTINTDAASSDLKQAVEGILMNFPPR